MFLKCFISNYSYIPTLFRYRGSDDMNTVPVMSQIMWREVINYGCDTLWKRLRAGGEEDDRG